MASISFLLFCEKVGAQDTPYLAIMSNASPHKVLRVSSNKVF